MRAILLAMTNFTSPLLTTAAFSSIAFIAWAQELPPTILEIEVDGLTFYVNDQGDPQKHAFNTAPTPVTPVRNFSRSVAIADVIAINGQAARGTMFRIAEGVSMNPNPQAGRLVTATTRSGLNTDTFELLNPDGTTILAIGLGVGTPPPGAPLQTFQGANVVTGGSGAFYRIRGQGAMVRVAVPARQVSNTEDPVNRRANGGGRATWLVQFIPNERPQVNSTPNGPAITHSNDFSLVSASKPAAQGELLSVFLTGLGPTRPGVDPGKPFPANANVNSPLQVLINGKAAEVIGAVGYPGTVGHYQLNFRVPSDATPGTATMQISSAWVAGPEVKFAVR
jgi:uncharacterized protein (TIGR03437 family)